MKIGALKFYPLLISITIVLIILLIPIKWIQGLIGDRIIEQSAYQQNTIMFQGYSIQNKMLAEGKYLPIYGSSELSSYSVFHPSNFFLQNNKGFTPFLIGRGGTQSLIHFLSLSQFKGELHNQKVVIIISPQWFEPAGIREDHFSRNFSLLQAYNLAFNNELDPKLKKKAIKRLLSFNLVKDDVLLTELYKAEISNSFYEKFKAILVKPAAFLHKSILEKKDFFQSITLKEQKIINIDDEEIKNKSFNYLLEYANQVGKENVTNNSLSIMDSYYNQYIKKDLKKYKNSYSNISYSTSVEYDDLAMLIQFLHDADAKALFISVPVNGFWYDYTGFPKERRAEYYKKVNHLITSNGYELADFSNFEYEQYFLKDIMHIGWKGWVHVNEKLEEFYNE